MAPTTRTTIQQRSRIERIEFGKLGTQENGYDSALATAEIVEHYKLKSPAVIKRTIEWSGGDEVGAGHEYPSQQYELSRGLEVDIPVRLTAEMGALFAALLMGKCVSAINGAGASYSHTLTDWDKTAAQATGQAGYSQAPATSFRYEDGGGQSIASGVCLQEMEISGGMKDFGALTAKLVGSGTVASNADSFQTAAEGNNLRLENVQVGVAGSEESLVDAVRDVTWKGSRELALDEGYTAGSENVRSQILGGALGYALTLKFDQHSTDTELTNFLANTALKVILTYQGVNLHDAFNYDMIITMYQCRYSDRSQDKSGFRNINEMEFKPEADSSGNFMDIVLNNDEVTTYLPIGA